MSGMLEGVMQRFPGGPNAAGGSQAGNTPTCADERAAKSVDAKQATTIVFQNNRDVRVRIYWLNYQGQREHFQDLAPGRQHVQETYVSHPWIVTEENGRCIGLYMPEATRRQVEIRAAEMPASR
jgi:VHL beta domain